MPNDTDVTRAVGHLVIQAAHLERQVEAICLWLSAGVDRPADNFSASVSRKIKWCKSAILALSCPQLADLDESLTKAKMLFDRRNEIVHGRIYFDSELPEKLVFGRREEVEREITASELNKLGDEIYNLHVRILSENSFKLVAALAPLLDK